MYIIKKKQKSYRLLLKIPKHVFLANLYLFIYNVFFVENSAVDGINLISVLRMSSFTQNKSLEEKLYNLIKSSLNYECTTRFDRLTILTVLSKLQTLNHYTKTYFERWFTLLAETNCFLELDYAFLYKLLSSSNLRITSEIWREKQVFYCKSDFHCFLIVILSTF